MLATFSFIAESDPPCVDAPVAIVALPKPVRKKEIFLNVAPSTAPTQNPVSPTTGDNAVKSD